MLVRNIRELLDESMRTVKSINPTLEDVCKFFETEPSRTKVEFYVYDKRIGWDTYIVTEDGRAIGYCNSPIEHSTKKEDKDGDKLQGGL